MIAEQQCVPHVITRAQLVMDRVLITVHPVLQQRPKESIILLWDPIIVHAETDFLKMVQLIVISAIIPAQLVQEMLPAVPHVLVPQIGLSVQLQMFVIVIMDFMTTESPSVCLVIFHV
jgi:hypothetical protein